MRNPNGYGSVVKLSGKRRNPYVVRKTVGWDDNGYPIYSILGYFPSQKEANIALAEYNKNPYDINKRNATTKEVFDFMMEHKTFGRSNKSSLKSAFKIYLEPLHNVPYTEVRSYQMQAIIDNCGKGYSTQAQIKSLFRHLDNMALEIDVISKGYSGFLTCAPVTPKEKHIFTSDEIKQIWDDFDDTSKSILTLLYTGMRISELKIMEIQDGVIKTGVKTVNGKNRIIPIHPLIKDFIKPIDNLILFRRNFNKKMKQLNMSHTPHECRHTFRSILDKNNANKKCIDLIMGHKTNDVGLSVYTHKSISDLVETIALVTY